VWPPKCILKAYLLTGRRRESAASLECGRLHRDLILTHSKASHRRARARGTASRGECISFTPVKSLSRQWGSYFCSSKQNRNVLEETRYPLPGEFHMGLTTGFGGPTTGKMFKIMQNQGQHLGLQWALMSPCECLVCVSRSWPLLLNSAPEASRTNTWVALLLPGSPAISDFLCHWLPCASN
jgi:hypothetical protein